jgi:hypothetical protein
MDKAIAPDAAPTNGTEAVGDARVSDTGVEAARSDAAVTSGHVALTPSFLAGLAAAMRETAVRERDRISGLVAENASAHVEKVRSRAAIETEELRRLAEEDVGHIEQWRAEEIDRIKGEATQRISDRRSSLDEYLKQHDAIIETEIQGVDGAVKGFEATLDRFFADLAEETDPSAIVRQAGLLPTPPDLDEIRATARANAMAKLADAETGGSVETAPMAEPAAIAEPAAADAEAVVETTPIEPVSAEASESLAVAEPTQAEPEVENQPEETPAVAEPVADPAADPVGVMDPDAQRMPNWPAPAPRAEAAPIAPTMDNASAAVRLLRSVAPWTAPTHAGNRGEPDSD